MEKPTDQDYLIAKSQSDDLEDLIGRLLFRMLGVNRQIDTRIGIYENHDATRHAQALSVAREALIHHKVIGRVIGEVKKAILEKDIDLSAVVAGLKAIESGVGKSNDGIAKQLEALVKASPNIENSLKEVSKAIFDSRIPQKSFEGIVASQDKGFEALGGLLVSLTEAVKKEKTLPVTIGKPIEVAEPKWWKPFVFSWEPLEKLLEKLSKRTFKVEQAGVFEVNIKGLPKEISKALAEELTRIMPRIMPHAGYNNPFSFDEAGNLKITGAHSTAIIKKTVALTGSGVVLDPAAGKKIRLYSMRFSLSADMTDVAFNFGAGDDFEKYLTPKAGGLYGGNTHPDYVEGAVDETLDCVITGTGTVQINIEYLEI